MDRANLALAEYLLSNLAPVHLVGHSVDSDVAKHPLAVVHLVHRPLGSSFIGEWQLDRVGQSVARALRGTNNWTRVLVNGGNCCLPGAINWVHSVHQAWPCVHDGAPMWFRIKNRVAKVVARKREAAALRTARSIFANSKKTRSDVIRCLGIPSARIHHVYLGNDQTWRPPTAPERVRVRTQFPAAGPLVAFVGALSHDNNKGFDTLWRAWTTLCKREDWDAHLAVAGAGSGLPRWKSACAAEGLNGRVHFLGFTDRIVELLWAADLLVSPVRYEAYGLNVQEAICCGLPALVSSTAGVAERYPKTLHPMLLTNPEDADDLIRRLLAWRASVQEWKLRFQPLAAELRAYTWEDMARNIVSIVDQTWRSTEPAKADIGERLSTSR